MTNNYPYRPLYETAKDLKHEKEIAKKIEEALSWRLHKLSKAYFLDFIAFSKYPKTMGLVAFIEVRKRNNHTNKYPTVILSLNKYLKGVFYAKTLGVKFLFVVQFHDGCFAYTYAEDADFEYKALEHIQIGGRTDRNDPQDVEPVIHIPIDKFKPIFSTGGQREQV